MTQEQFNEFKEKFGAEAAIEMKKLSDAAEARLNTAFEAKLAGTISKEKFDEVMQDVKDVQLKQLNEKLVKAEEVAIKQGETINELKFNPGGKAKQKSLEEFLEEQMPKILELRGKQTGFYSITAKELKAAGVTSIGGSVQDMAGDAIASPYLPGIGGAELQLFDVARDPNFILNHVDLGRTNQVRLAWINETDYEGTVDANIAEGGTKPQLQHKFQVEYSKSKKAAAWIELTEEFDTDVPGLATAVRRMLRDDVIRAFDNQIQTDVIAAAKPYQILQLTSMILKASYWSAIRAMIGQVGHYNFQTNTVGINPLTAVVLDESKNVDGTYLIPPFMARVQSMLVEANKVAFDYGLVGDLKQYKVDIYKEFTMRVGWINEEFINNKFAILGELRYHSYISDSRKKAICYDNLDVVRDTIDTQHGS